MRQARREGMDFVALVDQVISLTVRRAHGIERRIRVGLNSGEEVFELVGASTLRGRLQAARRRRPWHR
jgi:hypothetical protein